MVQPQQQAQQPAQAAAREQPHAPKLGEGLVREMAARGASELAYGLGLPGHDYGNQSLYGQEMQRGIGR